MQLNYYICDEQDQIRRANAETVERLWRGQCLADEFDCPLSDRLRLITVLCDDDLNPLICYFTRLDLEEGAITEQSRIEAYEALTTRHRRRFDVPVAQRQFAGWPQDWQRQLAVALDVPASQVQRIGVGGPLLLADLWGIPLSKVLEYFEDAADRAAQEDARD